MLNVEYKSKSKVVVFGNEESFLSIPVDDKNEAYNVIKALQEIFIDLCRHHEYEIKTGLED